MNSVLIFIEVQHKFIKLHLHSTIMLIQTVTFIFYSSFYPFKSFLSIQQFFIHSTFTAHLSLRME